MRPDGAAPTSLRRAAHRPQRPGRDGLCSIGRHPAGQHPLAEGPRVPAISGAVAGCGGSGGMAGRARLPGNLELARMTTPAPAAADPRRDANGRWLPGHGPGRQFGSKNKNSRAALVGVQSLAPEAIQKLRERMLEGDMAAIKLILEYTLPKGGRTVDLGSNDPNAITDAMVHGEVSPDEGVRMAQAIKTVGDAAEIKELKRQVEELELLISSLANR